MPLDSPLAVIQSAIGTLAGADVLDVGCGGGGLARQLSAEGAHVTGIDPHPEALARARRLAPEALFETAGAESLPFADASFDAVVILNALHHVPITGMDKALDEAARVLRRSGSLIVIEPLAEGSYFAALTAVENERAVRLAAQEALRHAVARGTLRLERTVTYTRTERFDDIDRFLARIVAVDPARDRIVHSNREAIRAAILAVASPMADGGLALEQPIRADLLHPNRTG